MVCKRTISAKRIFFIMYLTKKKKKKKTFERKHNEKSVLKV